MKEECLICKAPREYLVQDEMMECAICGKTEPSKTRCGNGHYVCSEWTVFWDCAFLKHPEIRFLYWRR